MGVEIVGKSVPRSVNVMMVWCPLSSNATTGIAITPRWVAGLAIPRRGRIGEEF